MTVRMSARVAGHGYAQRRRTCSCELCAAYKRGYAAAQARTKNAKRFNDTAYEEDDIMRDLLP